MMNPFTIRWKVSPSKNPWSARNTKLATASGASFASSAMSKEPQEVSTVAV